MSFTFDGASRLIILAPGTVSVDLPDLYSRWKDWVRTGDNAKWAPFFDTVGGEATDTGGGTVVPLYLFLKDGARIRPQEANHTVSVVGGTLVSDGADAFADTLGNFRVRIRFSQPLQAIGYSTTGTGGPSAPAVAEAVWAMAVEAGMSAAELLRLVAAHAAGDATGLDGATTVFKSLDGSKARIVGTVNSSGARTVSTRDGG